MTFTNGLVATYRVSFLGEPLPSEAALLKKAEHIANGQTIGTANPKEMEALAAYKARVVSVEISSDSFPLKGTSALFKIHFPEITVSSDLGTLMAVVFGKVSMAGAIRLEDISLSDSLAAHYQGPGFGMQGIRALLNKPEGALLMSIFKPCLGMPVNRLGELFYQQALAGVHLIKDDEVLSDASLSTAQKRLEVCLKAGEKALSETAHRPLYAINLTGPSDQLLARARVLASEGATAFLFNYLCYGLPMLHALQQDKHIPVPLMAHPAMAGAFYGSPAHGIAPKVLLGILPRLAGADFVLFPSPYGSVALPLPEAKAVAEALRSATIAGKPSLPVPSAGIQPSMVPAILKDFGTDVVINAGTGIHDYPEGALAGAHAFLNQMNSATHEH